MPFINAENMRLQYVFSAFTRLISRIKGDTDGQ